MLQSRHATSSDSTPFGRRCGVAHVIFSPLVVLMRTRARVSVHVHGRAGRAGVSTPCPFSKTIGGLGSGVLKWLCSTLSACTAAHRTLCVGRERTSTAVRAHGWSLHVWVMRVRIRVCPHASPRAACVRRKRVPARAPLTKVAPVSVPCVPARLWLRACRTPYQL